MINLSSLRYGEYPGLSGGGGGLNIITDLFKEECRRVRDVYETMQKDGSWKKRNKDATLLALRMEQGATS